LRIGSTLGDRELFVCCLLGSSEVAARRDETARASRLLAAAGAFADEIGYRLPPLEHKQRERIVTLIDENDPEVAATQSDEGAMTLDEAVAYALEGLHSDEEKAPLP